MACKAGKMPANIPSATASPTPMSTSTVGKKNIGNMPPVGSPRAINTHASPRPIPPPSTASTQDSASTNESTCELVKPIALSAPSSPVRSRTAWPIVLPATSRIVKNTALRIVAVIVVISPICLAQAWRKAPSGSVFVSAAEFSNSWSTSLATSAACAGSFTRTRYQPTCPLFHARASSK